MPKITYFHPDGAIDTVEVAEGTSVMRAALANSVSGIVGECGGQAMCATCHVKVRNDADLPEVSEDEDEMLDCTVDERQENSRLGCQLIAGRDFDAIEVDVAEHQV
ncbi:ferredoxin [Pseudoclavibacter endophyticus]|uniref:2Fe-2S iron-sulfur cluster binding domain-containing protein n=1 Tax=Pseudoclavibacter endophyticus TaxID=1778590 RepID=A0A6H9WCI8_9MICO|nr:2Fe-2S iron-sulfur cluster-binding protein [Pseudoclavibacter endophyticus]KAB1648400.1 2Fe-2S iron-sulfur cluster binding domain-containing protein [Pseudoclavibacter endophyticus]GGA72385.1 ferredoxin [Pseudoclavibacter endophyticus]